MFLFPFYLSDSYLFYFRASCVSFLIAFFFLVFDEIIVFYCFLLFLLGIFVLISLYSFFNIRSYPLIISILYFYIFM